MWVFFKRCFFEEELLLGWKILFELICFFIILLIIVLLFIFFELFNVFFDWSDCEFLLYSFGNVFMLLFICDLKIKLFVKFLE